MKGKSNLTESFWQVELSNYNSFDAAMGLYKSIYKQLDNCSTQFCKCVETYPNEGYFFSNEAHFNDLKRIANPIKKKYVPVKASDVKFESFLVFY